MRWLIDLLTSSIGKKVQMAVTGLLLCGFLIAHLAGNLFLFVGRDAFNAYAEALEHNPLLPAAEIGLAFMFLLHIVTAIIVRYQNSRARPVGYVRKRAAGGRTWGSATMALSGALLLAFLIVHVKTFRFTPHGDDLYGHVISWFQWRPYAWFYVAAMLGLALHLSHGVHSGLSTLGIEHPKYSPILRKAGIGFALIIAAGFASMPIILGCADALGGAK